MNGKTTDELDENRCTADMKWQKEDWTALRVWLMLFAPPAVAALLGIVAWLCVFA